MLRDITTLGSGGSMMRYSMVSAEDERKRQLSAVRRAPEELGEIITSATKRTGKFVREAKQK